VLQAANVGSVRRIGSRGSKTGILREGGNGFSWTPAFLAQGSRALAKNCLLTIVPLSPFLLVSPSFLIGRLHHPPRMGPQRFQGRPQLSRATRNSRQELD